MLKHFLGDERGVTSIEYGLIASLIVIVIISAISSMGSAVVGLFGKANSAMATANGG